jgi:hypothetical protein
MKLARTTPQTSKESFQAIFNNNMSDMEKEFALLQKRVSGLEQKK